MHNKWRRSLLGRAAVKVMSMGWLGVDLDLAYNIIRSVEVIKIQRGLCVCAATRNYGNGGQTAVGAVHWYGAKQSQNRTNRSSVLSTYSIATVFVCEFSACRLTDDCRNPSWMLLRTVDLRAAWLANYIARWFRRFKNAASVSFK